MELKSNHVKHGQVKRKKNQLINLIWEKISQKDDRRNMAALFP